MPVTPQTGTGKQLVLEVGQASWVPGVVAIPEMGNSRQEDLKFEAILH